MTSPKLTITDGQLNPDDLSRLSHILGAKPFKLKLAQWQYTGPLHTQPKYIAGYIEDKLAAFNGIIPVEIWLNGSRHPFFWSCDFIVEKKLRGLGLGVEIKKALSIRFDKLLLASCGIAPKAYRLLIEHGWSEANGPIEYRKITRVSNFSDLIRYAAQIFFSLKHINLLKKHQPNVVHHFKDALPDNNTIDQLWESVKDTLPPCVVRDARYLNWRYPNHPIAGKKYQYLVTKNRGQLVSLTVIRKDADKILIVDHVGPGNDQFLLYSILKYVVRTNAQIRHFSIATNYSSWQRQILRSGFFRTGTRLKFATHGNHPELANMLIMKGDSDGELLQAAKSVMDES